jgi:hypothetical protein
MRTIEKGILTKTLLLTAILMAPSSARAYPPDNAAVLYYKACLLCTVDDRMTGILSDLYKGSVEPNEQVREILEKNRPIIDMVLDASEIDHCDWGYDSSQGIEVLTPPFHKFRQLSWLIAADAWMRARQGDYETALSRCMGIYRMGRHLSNGPTLNYIVGVGISAVGHKCVTRILWNLPPDAETLTRLKTELSKLDERPFSIKPMLRWKREAGIVSMSPDKIDEVVKSGLDDCPFKEKALARIRAADEQFFAGNVEYWKRYMDQIQAAFELPYPEAYARLQQLDEQPSQDSDQNTDATLTACVAPAFLRIYALDLRLRTESNAIRTAVSIYLVRATAGSLPETLAEGLPGDLFSGKPFQYAKTTDGFVLRCQTKDLDKNQPYEYQFKVAK